MMNDEVSGSCESHTVNTIEDAMLPMQDQVQVVHTVNTTENALLPMPDHVQAADTLNTTDNALLPMQDQVQAVDTLNTTENALLPMQDQVQAVYLAVDQAGQVVQILGQPYIATVNQPNIQLKDNQVEVAPSTENLIHSLIPGVTALQSLTPDQTMLHSDTDNPDTSSANLESIDIQHDAALTMMAIGSNEKTPENPVLLVENSLQEGQILTSGVHTSEVNYVSTDQPCGSISVQAGPGCSQQTVTLVDKPDNLVALLRMLQNGAALQTDVSQDGTVTVQQAGLDDAKVTDTQQAASLMAELQDNISHMQSFAAEIEPSEHSPMPPPQLMADSSVKEESSAVSFHPAYLENIPVATSKSPSHIQELDSKSAEITVDEGGVPEFVADDNSTEKDMAMKLHNLENEDKNSVLCREISCKLFSGVKVELSQLLFNLLPGTLENSVDLLKTLAKAHNLLLTTTETATEAEKEQNTYSLFGQLLGIVEIHQRLVDVILGFNGMAGCLDNICSDVRPMCDKSVHCDLLKPQYSRSGREFKWKTIETEADLSDLTIGRNSRPRRKGRQGNNPENTYMHSGKKKATIERTVNSLKSKDMIHNAKKTKHVKESVGRNPRGRGKASKTIVKEIIPAESLVDHADDVFTQLKDLANLPSGLPVVSQDAVVIEKVADSEAESITGADGSGCETTPARQKSIIFGRTKPAKDYENSKPFKHFCKVCSFKTKRISHLEKHVELHSKNIPLLKCKQCDFTTIRSGHLTRHEKIHSAVNIQCPACKYITDDRKLLSRHFRTKHNKPNGKNNKGALIFSCKQCEYNTTRSHLYTRHLRCHEDIDGQYAGLPLVKTYQCKLCAYKTKRKEHYWRHLQNVHHQRRPHLCDLCGKAFKRTDALQAHRLVHMDKNERQYPYTCQTCSKGFRSKAHLTEHQTIHSNLRPYLCEICGASFKTRSVQRKHIQTIHRNPRSFICTHCSKRFNTRYALRRHETTHHATQPQATDGMMLPGEEELATQRIEVMKLQDRDSTKVQILGTQQVLELGQVLVNQDMDAEQQVVITTSDALPESQIVQQAYEQATGESATAPATLIHGSEATTALLYLHLQQTELQ